MDNDQIHAGIALAIAVVWAAAWVHGPTRRALADGLRCLGRYPAIVKIPLAFALAAAAFRWVAEALLAWREDRWSFDWATHLDWNALAPLTVPWGLAAVRALERLASVGNDLVVAFPISSLIVLWICLARWRRIGATFRAIRARFPRTYLLWIFGLTITALAALAKPLFFLFLPEWIDYSPYDPSRSLLIALTVNATAMGFEIFVSTYFTILLMLMAFSWVRGLRSSPDRLHDLATRRMGYVLKWSFLVVLVSSLVLAIPSAVSAFEPLDIDLADRFRLWIEQPGRIVLALLLLVFFPVQAELVFHNRSLGSAIGGALRFMLRHAWTMSVFLTSAYAGFLLIQAAGQAVISRISGPSAQQAANAILLIPLTTYASWMLASWVCLFRRSRGVR